MNDIIAFIGGWKILNPLGVLLLAISFWFFSLALVNIHKILRK